MRLQVSNVKKFKPSSKKKMGLLTLPRQCFLCGSFLAIYICVFIAALRSPAWKNWPLGSLVCEVLLCFCQFPMWCPGSGVVLDCIDSSLT